MNAVSTDTGTTRDRLLALVGVFALLMTLVVPFAQQASAEDGATAQQDPQDVTVDRFDGGNRADTAGMIADEDHAGTAETVLLARWDDFPDSLAANYLAGQIGVPILISHTTHITSDTWTWLDALDTENVVILGGDAAISDDAEAELVAANYDVTRIDGSDRFETAALLATGDDADDDFDRTYGTYEGEPAAIVAAGRNFPDALVSGPLAADQAFPLLLTEQGSLPTFTADALGDLNIGHVFIPGGTAAVSQAVEDDINAMGIETTRFSGARRTETATMIADFLVDEFGFTVEHVNMGRSDPPEGFADVLALGPHAAGERNPIVLAWDPNRLDVSDAEGDTRRHTYDWLTDNACTIVSFHIGGGTAAVSQSVEDLAVEAAEDCPVVEPGDPDTLVLEPAEAVNPTDVTHTVTATVTDEDGNAVADDTLVRFEVYEDDGTTTFSFVDGGDVEETENGQASFTYGLDEGDQDTDRDDVIVACVVEDTTTPCTGPRPDDGIPSDTLWIDPVTRDARNVDQEPHDLAEKAWEVRVATTVELEQGLDVNFFGQDHWVTATVTDQFDDPFAGDDVLRGELYRSTDDGETYTFEGALSNVETDGDGQASESYTHTGPEAHDIIVVCLDDTCATTDDDDQVEITTDLSFDTVEKHWVDEDDSVNVTLSWENEVGSPFGAVEDETARQDPDGSAEMRWNTDSGLTCWELTYEGWNVPEAAHLHEGALDENGDIVIDFDSEWVPTDEETIGEEEQTWTSSGCAIADSEVLEDLDAQLEDAEEDNGLVDYYVNIHTDVNPPGEVRGQLPDGGQGELPPIFRQIDEGDDSGDASTSLVDLRFTDSVGAYTPGTFEDPLTGDDFTVLVNGVDVDAELFSTWTIPGNTETLEIDAVLELGDDVSVTLDSPEKIVNIEGEDLSDSVDTRTFVIGLGQGQLAGTVTDAETEDGIENVDITFWEGTDEEGDPENEVDSRDNATDAEGDYAELIGPGTYTVTYEAEGYQTAQEDDVVIEAGQTTVLDVEMEPAEAEEVNLLNQPSDTQAGDHIQTTGGQDLQVEVLDENGDPVEGATVTAASDPDGLVGTPSAVTDASGVATFDGDIPSERLEIRETGTYTLTFTSQGIDSDESDSFTITPGPADDVDPDDIRNQTVEAGEDAPVQSTAPGTTVFVDVTDEFGNDVADGTNVNATLDDLDSTGATLGGTTTQATTNGTASFGSLEIQDLPTEAGDYEFQIDFEADGEVGTTNTFTVTVTDTGEVDGDQTDVVVTTSSPAELEFSVRDEFGNGIEGLTASDIQAEQIEPASGPRLTLADDGRFTGFSDDGDGEYSVVFDAPEDDYGFDFFAQGPDDGDFVKINLHDSRDDLHLVSTVENKSLTNVEATALSHDSDDATQTISFDLVGDATDWEVIEIDLSDTDVTHYDGCSGSVTVSQGDGSIDDSLAGEERFFYLADAADEGGNTIEIVFEECVDTDVLGDFVLVAEDFTVTRASGQSQAGSFNVFGPFPL